MDFAMLAPLDSRESTGIRAHIRSPDFSTSFAVLPCSADRCMPVTQTEISSPGCLLAVTSVCSMSPKSARVPLT